MINSQNLLLSLVLIGVLSIVGCQDKASTPPPNLMSLEIFKNVLKDLHIVDAAVIKSNLPIKQAFDQRKIYYEAVYKKYGISSEKFEKDYLYYSKDIPQMDTLYATILREFNEALPAEQQKMNTRTVTKPIPFKNEKGEPLTNNPFSQLKKAPVSKLIPPPRILTNTDAPEKK